MKNLICFTLIFLFPCLLIGQINITHTGPKEDPNKESSVLFKDGPAPVYPNDPVYKKLATYFKHFHFDSLRPYFMEELKKEGQLLEMQMDRIAQDFNTGDSVRYYESFIINSGPYIEFESNLDSVGLFRIDYKLRSFASGKKIYGIDITYKNKKYIYPRIRYEWDQAIKEFQDLSDSDPLEKKIEVLEKFTYYDSDTMEYSLFYRNKTRSLSAFRTDGVLAGAYGNLSYYYLLTNQAGKSIISAKRGLFLDPQKTWIYTNLAPAYLMNGELEKAKQIYLRLKDQDFSKERKYSDVFLEDIKTLREKGISIPHFEDIQRLLKM